MIASLRPLWMVALALALHALLLAGCSQSPAAKDSGRFHVDGWSDPALHGQGAKFQEFECTGCHGGGLTGGSVGVSCDTCHASGWRTNCTFCHGGADNGTGAPPVDLDGLSTDLSFPEHTAHVTEQGHPAWTCDQCHARPADVLTPGHIFVGDSTPGVAEVRFDGGLSADGAYDGGGSCSNLYCHGDGAGGLGSVVSGATLDCGSCHGGAADPGGLSGAHPDHLAAGISCAECHANTASDDDTISDPAQHVDGEVDVSLTSGMSYDSGSCSGTCHGVDHDGSAWSEGSFHPAGWDAADQHGPAAKLQEQDCTACHGADLTGGTSGTSCDSCHLSGWRTDCTYCHGGTDNTTGAPPRDIDGLDTGLSFTEHSVHVQEGNHAAWDCAQCHTTPTDVLSVGHLFVGDTTPGEAEVAFTDGLSADAVYEGAGTCTNSYCHGDGVTPGAVTTGATTDCGSCHGTASSPGTLSTVHAAHFDEGASCEECHAATVSASDIISDPAQHVDGEIDVQPVSGMVYSGGTCSGSCHGVDHDGSTWTEGGFHPAGWDAADEHGLAAKLQEQDCTTCHGADLAGGTSGTSCDSCHASGWRTDCTYCHGGEDNATGAPPVDIDGLDTGLSFAEHSVHVEVGNHAAWDCAQCHTTPTDVLSVGHLFVGDTTPGEAEVAFTDSLSADAVYEGAGTCSNSYCHGDGVIPGSVTSGTTTDCGSCHGTASSPGTLSTVHAAHFDEGASCEECHAATVSASDTISDPAQHVDGEIDVQPVSGMVYSGGTCSGSCHGVDHDGSTWAEGGFHPAGWDAADDHGLAAKLQEQDCTTCHGSDLAGGTSGTSCDSCHVSGWRTDCTYCHGGEDNATGAPPVDIDGSSTALSFDEHTLHVDATTNHAAWDCVQCHATPTDVLSVGHVFIGDTTPGVAEVAFSGGLSGTGAYGGGGSCSNLYCHGNGNGTLGSVSTGVTTDCGSCHGTASSTTGMSGEHSRHLGPDVRAACHDCHATTASGSSAILDPALHVNGTVETSFPSGMVYSGTTCSGTCHTEGHSRRRW